MTLDDIEIMHQDSLTPAQVADVLGCNPYSINIAARDDPESLGFPVIRIGTRVKIPRAAFIRFMHGELPSQRKEGCSDCFGIRLTQQRDAGHSFCRSCGKRLMER